MPYENKLESWWSGLPGEVQSVFGFAFDWANDMLESVAGDPDDLARAGAVYAGLGPQMTDLGTTIRTDALSLGASWTGDAFEAFRAKIEQLQDQVEAAGGATADTDQILRAAAEAAVDGANTIVDIVVMIIEFALATLVLALASSVLSLGASMAAWFAGQLASAATMMARVLSVVQKVAQVLTKVSEILRKIAEILKSISAMFKQWEAMIKAMKILPTSLKSASAWGTWTSDQIVKAIIAKTYSTAGVPILPGGATGGLPDVIGDLGDLKDDVDKAQSVG